MLMVSYWFLLKEKSIESLSAAARAPSMTQSWLDMPFHVPLKETFFLFNWSGNLATKGVLKHEKCLELSLLEERWWCTVQTNIRYLVQSTNQIELKAKSTLFYSRGSNNSDLRIYSVGTCTIITYYMYYCSQTFETLNLDLLLILNNLFMYM